VASSIPTLPNYIKETYIDSTEIRSPNISWNTGYFSWLVKVWSSGIDIDWVNKIIKSNNYVSWTSGWKIDNTWYWEFNDVEIRGDIKAGTININDNFKVDSSWNVRGNVFTNKATLYDTTTPPTTNDGQLYCNTNWWTGKILWAYMWWISWAQQISMSWMCINHFIDIDDSNSEFKINTRFQPRSLFFNWCFIKGSWTVGVSNWNANKYWDPKGSCSTMRNSWSTYWVYAYWNTYFGTWEVISWVSEAFISVSSPNWWEDDGVNIIVRSNNHHFYWTITVIW
jgi:hypothetical protein